MDQPRPFVAIAAAVALACGTARGEADPINFEAWAADRASAIRDSAAGTRDFGASARDAQQLFAQIVAYHPDPGASEALGRTYATALHLSHLAQNGAPGDAGRIAQLLMENPVLAEAIAALFEQDADDADGVYRVVSEIIDATGKSATPYPELVAAAAVVFDQGTPRALVEQRVADPVDAATIVAHLIANARGLTFDLGAMPGELLVHVVDAPVSREDLAWAMTNYTGDRGVGQRFHDIEYDLGLDGLTSLDAPLDGRASVFSLPVLRSAGGVCRHQAYFAASIGKAIGVPTVWIRADGPDVGHAWVGYLTQRGRNAAWDVNEGRFGFYDRVRGEVRCPQTGREFSDQAIAMKADFFGASLQDRLRGRALAVAAIVLADAEANPDTTPWPPTLPEGLRTVDQTARLSSRQRRAMALSEPRAANAENRFDLLEMSVDAAPASMFAWRLMSAWSDDMDLARRQRWFEAASTLVGKRYPDVLRELVAPMIAGMDDHEARDAAWGWLAARMAKHPELALDVETARAGDLIERGEGEAAWQGLGDAARRYVRDVPGVVDTLRIAEGIASKAPNGPAALADLYGEVYSKSPPAEANLPPPYDRASVRSRLGRRYVYWLKKAGRADEARRIEQTLTGSSRP